MVSSQEPELGNDSNDEDVSIINFQAMKVVSDQQTREARAKQEKEKELSKVKINKDDVDLIVSQIQ